jgi:hypothetical protein
MATIDPSIALGVRPVQIENPLNQLAAMTQIQSGQQGQQLNMLKMQEAQQDMADRNALREIPGDINDPDYIKNVAKVNPKLAAALQKDIATYKKTSLESEGLVSKNLTDRYKQEKDIFQYITTPEQFLARSLYNLKDPLLGPQLKSAGVTEDSIRQKLDAAIKQPGGFEQLLNQNILTLAKFTELNKPQYIQENLGGTNRITAVPGLGIGAPRVVSEASRTPTQGELLVDRRTREAVERGERRDIVASTSTDAAGNVTQFNKFGDVINKVTAAGKPSATFEKTAALQKQQAKDLKMAITEIEKAIEPSGLLEKSTGSGAGRAFDVTAGFFGYAPPGAIAAASLKPIADLGLKMIPRFEGPQSDKDTASYKQAAGELANDSLPVAIRLAAAKTVVRLMKTRTGQFVNETMATEGLPAGGPALPAGFTVDKP